MNILRQQRRKQQGVTLVELVIVMIVFSVLAVPLSNGFLTVSKSTVINAEVKAANNLTRSCAEHILHQRRRTIGGITSAITPTGSSTLCDTAVTGFSASGNLAIAANATVPLCPALSTCDELTITADNSSGQTLSTISLLFVY